MATIPDSLLTASLKNVLSSGNGRQSAPVDNLFQTNSILCWIEKHRTPWTLVQVENKKPYHITKLWGKVEDLGLLCGVGSRHPLRFKDVRVLVGSLPEDTCPQCRAVFEQLGRMEELAQ